MRSRMSIEYDFECAEPVIRVVIEHDSDDMRDKMLHHFFELVNNNHHTNNRVGLVYEKSPNPEEHFSRSVIKLFPLGSKVEKQAYPLTFDIAASIPIVDI